LGARIQGSIVEAKYLSHDAPVHSVRIEPLSDLVESSEMLSIVRFRWCLNMPRETLTSGSNFFTDLEITSRVFFVQCGRQGNSAMRVSATL
jgi:hypothetical protein